RRSFQAEASLGLHPGKGGRGGGRVGRVAGSRKGAFQPAGQGEGAGQHGAIISPGGLRVAFSAPRQGQPGRGAAPCPT
ncbi:unnamed protein product, partial [Effrenium voratum]